MAHVVILNTLLSLVFLVLFGSGILRSNMEYKESTKLKASFELETAVLCLACCLVELPCTFRWFFPDWMLLHCRFSAAWCSLAVLWLFSGCFLFGLWPPRNRAFCASGRSPAVLPLLSGCSPAALWLLFDCLLAVQFSLLLLLDRLLAVPFFFGCFLAGAFWLCLLCCVFLLNVLLCSLLCSSFVLSFALPCTPLHSLALSCTFFVSWFSYSLAPYLCRSLLLFLFRCLPALFICYQPIEFVAETLISATNSTGSYIKNRDRNTLYTYSSVFYYLHLFLFEPLRHRDET